MCVFWGGYIQPVLFLCVCVCQEQKGTLQELKDKMDSMQRERERDAEELRMRTAELRKSMEHEGRMKKETEVRQTHTHRGISVAV